ncbi:MAG: hypothetical protein RIA71_02370 [Oceanicaulis sp.]
MFDRFSPWKKDTAMGGAPTRLDAGELARRRAELWVEFKRLHLGFGQALNAVTYGRSNMLALIKHALLAEYEARKLHGTAETPGPDLILGEAMRQTVTRCQGAYGRINASTFEEKALSALAEDADPHLIALMLNLTTAPFRIADAAVFEAMVSQGLDAPDRVMRFTPEIRSLHKRLREHFTERARRAGLV